MPGYEFFMKPRSMEIEISLEEVHNVLYSLMLLDYKKNVQGLNPSLIQIFDEMSEDQRAKNHLVMNGLFYALIPSHTKTSFDEYLVELEKTDPLELRDRLLNVYRDFYEKKIGQAPKVSYHTESQDFLSYLTNIFGEEKIDRDMESVAHQFLMNPPEMKKLISGHLREMWELFLRDEWNQNLKVLNESMEAYKSAGFEQMGKINAVRSIGCEAMDCDWDQLQQKVDRADKVYLVPSPHLGPYQGKIHHPDSDVLWLLYGNLLPDGQIVKTGELSKSDLLVRFSALNDGSRLEIMKLCSSGREYSSGEVMDKLQISQSAVSRHLKQLSATGFLKERRENSSKYYMLDKDKVKNTIGSLAGYLNLDSD